MKIGVNYYPEHWDKALWAADADLMKKTGVQIVRMAEFAWSRMEPREGEFDFAWLDEAVALFAECGIEVILGTPTSCPPMWLYEKHPDIVQIEPGGQPIRHQEIRCPARAAQMHQQRLTIHGAGQRRAQMHAVQRRPIGIHRKIPQRSGLI